MHNLYIYLHRLTCTSTAAGISEDSDYTSDVSFPVHASTQHQPNWSAHQLGVSPRATAGAQHTMHADAPHITSNHRGYDRVCCCAHISIIVQSFAEHDETQQRFHRAGSTRAVVGVSAAVRTSTHRDRSSRRGAEHNNYRAVPSMSPATARAPDGYDEPYDVHYSAYAESPMRARRYGTE
jgi:hypothetical protein